MLIEVKKKQRKKSVFLPEDNLFNGSSTTAAHPGDPQELKLVCPMLKQDHMAKVSLGWLVNEARCKITWTMGMDKCRSQGSLSRHCPGLDWDLAGSSWSQAAHPGSAVLSGAPMWLSGCTLLPLWLLLKPDLFALKIRNLFMSSPTTLSLEISQDFLSVSLLPCVSQKQLYPLQPCSDSQNEIKFR